MTIQIVENAPMRRLCSGKTLAFQAKDAGSIPAARSNNSYALRPSNYWKEVLKLLQLALLNSVLGLPQNGITHINIYIDIFCSIDSGLGLYGYSKKN